MKRLGSSDSLSGLMSICQNSTDEHNHGSSHVYSREFQSMLEGLDEEGCVEESGHIPEKKRRLSVDQVKALEKNFEVENKLEPDRKVKLAQELGLQPRQVAVWFQNRRARWKTKQLERDYGVLKANFDALKHNYEKLQLENDVLIQEIDELKSKLQDDKGESNVSVKEEAEALASESEDIAMDTEKEKEKEKEKAQMDDHVITEYDDEEEEATELNFESFNSNNGLNLMGVSLFTDIKDGSSDSDSSAILNEDNNINNNINHSPNAASSVGKMLQMAPLEFFNNTSNGSSSQLLSMGGFQFSDSKATAYQPQFVKIEEHNFFSGDESCSTFFSDDQPPSLHWDCPEEWN